MKRKEFVLFPKKLSCGTTVYYYAAYDENGKRRQFSTGKKNEIEAMKVCIERMSRGNLVKSNRLAFNEYAKDFYDYDKSVYIRGKLARGFRYARSTAERNQNMTIGKMIPFFKDKPLNLISPNDIENFVQGLKKSGLSNTTVNHHLKTLKVIFKEACRNGDITFNPAEKVMLFKSDTRDKGILSKSETEFLFFRDDSISKCWGGDIVFYTINLLAFTTGLRIGEIQALQKDDVDSDRIIVRHSWSERFGMGETKTGTERTVPISEKVANLILIIGSRNFGEFIFSRTGGKTPIRRAAIYNSFYLALSSIGIDEKARLERNVTFHSWRHTFASVLANSNMPEVQIRQLTGHASQQVFERYAHAQFDKMKESIAACF